MKKIYNITILIERKESFQVEAESVNDAETLALEKAIAKHPGADVWLEAQRI